MGSTLFELNSTNLRKQERWIINGMSVIEKEQEYPFMKGKWGVRLREPT